MYIYIYIYIYIYMRVSVHVRVMAATIQFKQVPLTKSILLNFY